MSYFQYQSQGSFQPKTSLGIATLTKSVKSVAATIAKIIDSNPNRIKILIANDNAEILLFCFDSEATPVPSDTVCLELPQGAKFIEEGAYSAANLNLFAGGFVGDIVVWEWII